VTALVLTRPSVRDQRLGRLRATPSLLDDAGPEQTLDELLAGVWEEIAAHRQIPCPICAAELKPQYGVHARPIGGRCDSCGSTLS